MAEAKDTAGTALFFAAGTAAGEWLSMHMPGNGGLYRIAAAAMLLLVASSAAAWILKDRGSRPPALIFLVFALAGFLCPVTCAIHDDISILAGSIPSGIVTAQSGKFRSLIDSIPYDDRDSAAIIKALISGDRSDVAPHIRDAFRDSGASHILALSGMHLGIIYAILLKLFSAAGNTPAARTGRSVAIIVISAWYTAITGAASSLVRAMLFITLSETAKIIGRETRPMNIFFIALTIQLAFSPENIMSPGFQLSYLAMAGIYLLYPKMKRWFPGPEAVQETEMRHSRTAGRKTWRSPMKRLWDAAALTISCQIFTAPAVWFHFGTFPKYFIITNLLAVPLSNLIMMVSVAVIALSAIGICPPFLIKADCFCIGLLKDILVTISSLP